MTAPAIATVLPSRDELDELVLCLLQHVRYASKGLDKPLTPTRIHAIQQHLAVIELALLTPPLRPDGIEVRS